MSLLTICQEAVDEVGGLSTPSYIVGSKDVTAKKCLAMVNRLGIDLQRQYKWNDLKTEYYFDTVAGLDHYPLPSTWQRMSNNTQWDRTSHWPMNGPATDSFWQVLKSGLVIAGMRFWFRIENGEMLIAPTPISARRIAFNFFENTWAASAAGIPKSKMALDTDVPAFLPNGAAEDLLTLGLIYKLKASETLPFAEDKANYLAAIDAAQFDSQGQAMIDVSGSPRYVLGRGNLPEIGFGGP